MPPLKGWHGADPNLTVCIGAVPYTVPGHECGGIVAHRGKGVHDTSLPPMRGPIAATAPMKRLPGCSYACAAEPKCSSAAIVIAARCTVPRVVPRKRAGGRSARPVAVTRRVVAAASNMRRERAVTGRAKIT